MAEHDAVVVGSGVNGLACAALLAKAGWDVCVLERNDWFGGCIRTAEITEPGFKHDVFSAWHPLWVGGPAHAQLGDDLARHGLEYVNTDFPTATAFPDGESAFLLRTADGQRGRARRGVARRARRGSSRPPISRSGCSAPSCGRSTARPSGCGSCAVSAATVRATSPGELLVSARDWLETTFASRKAHGVIAPWVLHTGLGPDAAASGYMAQVIAVAVQEGGMPIPVGGGAKLADALVSYIRAAGGRCETGAHVERVFAGAVHVAGGETIGGAPRGRLQRHADPALR